MGTNKMKVFLFYSLTFLTFPFLVFFVVGSTAKWKEFGDMETFDGLDYVMNGLNPDGEYVAFCGRTDYSDDDPSDEKFKKDVLEPCKPDSPDRLNQKDRKMTDVQVILKEKSIVTEVLNETCGRSECNADIK